jgi:hypothetical protein
MRINFVLPHVVYVYQKQKMKKDDLTARLVSEGSDGKFIVELDNHSSKLGRVESVTVRGFEKPVETGGFPIFPGKKRQVVLDAGKAGSSANVKVSFQDGFALEVPIS